VDFEVISSTIRPDPLVAQGVWAIWLLSQPFPPTDLAKGRLQAPRPPARFPPQPQLTFATCPTTLGQPAHPGRTARYPARTIKTEQGA
jgi:hypothetical protein